MPNATTLLVGTKVDIDAVVMNEKGKAAGITMRLLDYDGSWKGGKLIAKTAVGLEPTHSTTLSLLGHETDVSFTPDYARDSVRATCKPLSQKP